MTKLFSMKSLAFAGAAAFALTLVAAPNASAEEKETKLTKDDVTVSYEDGILTVTADGATTVDDGPGFYFGSGKSADKIKYVMAPDSAAADNKGDEGAKAAQAVTYDISNLLGKKITVGVALDAKGTGAYTCELTESPKLTAKTDITDDMLTKGTIKEGNKFEYKVGTYGRWEKADGEADGNLVTAVKRAKLLGTTIYFRMATVDKSGQMTSPWSKEVKVKIKAKAKAPKVAVKTVKLTKEFQWNMSSKLEYKVTVGENTSEEWKTGGGKTPWATLIKDSGVKADANLVNGDAIAADVQFQVRTVGDSKKDPSQIAVLDLKQSPDSPDSTQIEAKVVNGKKGATVSAAAISPKTMPTGYMAQYSLDNKAWKNLTKETTLEGSKLSSSKLYIRLVGDGQDKNNTSILPSAVTTLTFPANGSASDDKDAKNKITAIALTSDGEKWTETKEGDIADYTQYKKGE